jgi:Tfp pilus assembly protein PilN
MSSIDFLPNDYVCVQTRRLQARWRRVSLVMLTSLVAYGAVNESYRQMQAEQTRIAVATRLRALGHQLPNSRALERRLEAAEQEADRLARVELSIRPSRVFAAISSALPQGTRLTELSLKFDTSPQHDTVPQFDPALAELAGRDVPRRGALANAAKGTGPQTPESNNRLRIVVRGLAVSDERIAMLLNQLEATGLFAGIQLQRIERESSAADLRQFHLELIVDPPRLSTRAALPLTVRTVQAGEDPLDLPQPLLPRRDR